MKITIEIKFPPNSDNEGIKVIRDRLPEEIKKLLMNLANLTVPENEVRRDGAEVSVVIQ